MKSPRRSRETSPAALRPALLRRVGRKISAKGSVVLPCVPALLDQCMTKLATLFELLGKPFTEAELGSLRQIVQGHMDACWRAAPFGLIYVEYETKPPPHPGIQYTVKARIISMDQQYTDWVNETEPPLFGKLPDAKVMAAAAALGPPAGAPVLDVGAGTGRNALPLAQLGHPADALEAVPALAGEIRKAAEEQKVAVNVIEGNILDPALALPKDHYRLIVMAEVIASHFRDAEQVRRAMGALSAALAPGGTLLFSSFLALDGYKPDAMARQVSQLTWSCIFTRGEFAFMTDTLGLDFVADESVFEYEKTHLPAEGWPPTGWFVKWAQGLDVFSLPEGTAPIDLRWLTYRKR